MSVIGDALKGIQQIMLMQSRIERIESGQTKITADVEGIAGGLQHLAGRVARIEGFIEGAAAAPRRARLPKA